MVFFHHQSRLSRKESCKTCIYGGEFSSSGNWPRGLSLSPSLSLSHSLLLSVSLSLSLSLSLSPSRSLSAPLIQSTHVQVSGCTSGSLGQLAGSFPLKSVKFFPTVHLHERTSPCASSNAISHDPIPYQPPPPSPYVLTGQPVGLQLGIGKVMGAIWKGARGARPKCTPMK